MDGHLIDQTKQEKREREIGVGLSKFQQNFQDVKYRDEAAYLITEVYYKILRASVKPLVPTRVSKFKIGALLALTVVRLQPIIGIENNNEFKVKEQRRLNAELAFFLAMNLILDMAKPEGYELNSGIVFLDGSTKKIKDQHLQYLTVKEKNSFPVFPIASFYYCFFLLYQSRYNAMMT